MTKEMKILNLFIEKGCDLTHFYTLRITEGFILFQGRVDRRKVKLYESMDFLFDYDKENCWFEATKIVENERNVGDEMSETKITITLTLS